MTLNSPYFCGPENEIAHIGIDIAETVSIQVSCSMGKIRKGFSQFLSALRATCPLTDRPEPAFLFLNPLSHLNPFFI